MNAKDKEYDFDVIKISYCKKHKLHWIWNCPECMAEIYQEDGRQAGIREILELMVTNNNTADEYWGYKCIDPDVLEAKLKEIEK